MGRFYAELSVTIYADSEDEATNVAEAAAHLIKAGGIEEVGSIEVVDVEADSANGEEG